MKIAIIGMPKTGTTALYESIKLELPAGTATSFEPKNKAELDYLLSEKRDAVLTKIMFTRLNDIEFDVNNFDKTIVIVRDPRDYLVSSLLYKFDDPTVSKNKDKLSSLICLFEKKQANPSEVSFTELYRGFNGGVAKINWDTHLKLYVDLLKFIEKNDVFLLKYEDFATDSLDSLNEYLSLSVKNKRELEGWTAKIQRKGTSGDWKNWFTIEDLYLQEVFNNVMTSFGYTDWILTDNPIIEKKHSLEYIQKLIEANQSDPTKPQEITPQYIENLYSAAKDNKVIPLTRLALLKLEGKSIEYDLLGAFIMLQKAAAMGSVRAQREVGKIILSNCSDNLKGTGEGADYYFFQAEKQDDPESCYFLGEMNLKGEVIIKDYDLAFKYFLKGAELGSKSCMRRLAHCYEKGIGTDINESLKNEWLARKAQ